MSNRSPHVWHALKYPFLSFLPRQWLHLPFLHLQTSHPKTRRIVTGRDSPVSFPLLSELLPLSFCREMLGLIRIKPFRGLQDGPENPFIGNVKCAADSFEACRNPSSATGLEKCLCRFSEQYFTKNSDAEHCGNKYYLLTKKGT